jgi:cytochrome c-type biogenesis protein CcmH/NrfF
MMRASAFPIALAALLALVALAAVMLLRPGSPPGQGEQARQIAAELRCPDCQGLSVADSSTPSAVQIRRQIEAQLSAGRSADQVRQSFVDRYGDWILLSPAAPLAWLLPLAVVLAAVGLLAWWMWRGRASAPVAEEAADPAVTEVDRARAREEAEALDA